MATNDTPPDVERLFQMHEAALGRFLAQITRDRDLAQDLLQDTFVAVCQGHEALGGVANVEAWLFGIARNRALAALRSRSRRLALWARLAAEPRATASDAGDAVAVRDFLERHLGPDDRAALILHYAHGFDGDDLAAILGCTRAAARQRVSRARRRLLARLDAADTPAVAPVPRVVKETA